MKSKIIPLLIFITCLGGFIQAERPGGEVRHCQVIQGLVNKVNADSIRSYLQSLQDFETRFCLVDNRRDVAVWIKNKFASFGIELVRLDSFELNMNFLGELHETWQYNVVATLPGRLNPDEVFVLGAHHDSICYDSTSDTPWECSLTNAPGADDNASGVAAALEVARIIMGTNYQPEGTIKFVTFAAEEVGLRGAWDFANKAANEGMDIKAMINNDMISNSTLPEDQWELQVHGYPNAEWLSDLAVEMINQYTVFDAVLSNQSLNATDSWAFHENGFPALFLHEREFSPFYHSVNDLVENTNRHYAAEATKVSLALLLQLNGTDQCLQVNNPNDFLIDAVVSPNPIGHKATIRLSLMETQRVSVRAFDSVGRVVLELSPTKLSPGNHQIEIDTTSLQNGLYLFSITSGSFNQTLKVLKH